MNRLSEPITFQLLITRHNGSDILTVSCGCGWTLPQVCIDSRRRFAEQLTEKVKLSWDIDSYCLSLPGLTAGRENVQIRHAVMESVYDSNVLAPGTCWLSRARAKAEVNSFSEKLIQALCDDEGGDTGTRGPFSRPGWMRELRNWVETRLEPLGLQLSKGFRQLNAGESFSLVRFETKRDAVWFKATGSPNKHELPLTAFLSSHFPGYVPVVLAIHDDWNGWLSFEARGQSLSEPLDICAWEQTAKALAELQIASIGKIDALLGAQARDQRLPILSGLINPFVVRMNELMLAQQKRSPAPLSGSELDMIGASLGEGCEFLESFHLPDTIGHSDLNPNNVLMANDGCVFLDWAEGNVSNPLLTFEYLRQFFARTAAGSGAASGRLANAYLRPWASFYSRQELRRALTLAPLIAIFAYAVATEAWRSADPSTQPKLAAYFRSLARRMYRESIHLKEPRAACVR